MAEPDPYDESMFNAQSHRLSDAWQIGTAKNTLGLAQAESAKIDQLAKLKLGYNRSEGGFRSSFAHRGLRNSGLFTQGYGERTEDYNTQINDVNRNYADHRNSLLGEGNALNLQWGRGVADVEAMRIAKRQQVAAQIR